MKDRIDLVEYLLKKEWHAGEQLEALQSYIDKDLTEFVWTKDVGSYQGTCFTVMYLKYSRVFVLWRDSYGSCSGCDGLDGRSLVDGLEYIKGTLQEGNTKQFDHFSDLLKFIITSEDYLWEELKQPEQLDELIKLKDEKGYD